MFKSILMFMKSSIDNIARGAGSRQPFPPGLSGRAFLRKAVEPRLHRTVTWYVLAVDLGQKH